MELPYWDAQEFFEALALPNRYQETSLFAREISDDFIDEIFRIWPSWPSTASAARLTCLSAGREGQHGSADATAFVHRSSRWIDHHRHRLERRGQSAGGSTIISNGSAMCRTTSSRCLVSPGAIYNFPDPGLENHATAYWGNNLPASVADQESLRSAFRVHAAAKPGNCPLARPRQASERRMLPTAHSRWAGCRRTMLPERSVTGRGQFSIVLIILKFIRGQLPIYLPTLHRWDVLWLTMS